VLPLHSTHTDSHDAGSDRSRYRLFLCILFRNVPVVETGAVWKYDLIDHMSCITLVVTCLTLSEEIVVCILSQYFVTFKVY
jgi:hypothetical protein